MSCTNAFLAARHVRQHAQRIVGERAVGVRAPARVPASVFGMPFSGIGGGTPHELTLGRRPDWLGPPGQETVPSSFGLQCLCAAAAPQSAANTDSSIARSTCAKRFGCAAASGTKKRTARASRPASRTRDPNRRPAAGGGGGSRRTR